MLEFSKRWGPHFFGAFILLVLGIVQNFIFLKDSPDLMRNLAIILSILAVICLILSIITLFYDLRSVYKKNKEKKREANHKASVESFKRAGMTDEMAEIAATGDTEPYQSIDGLEDDGWVSIREVSNKSCRKKK